MGVLRDVVEFYDVDNYGREYNRTAVDPSTLGRMDMRVAARMKIERELERNSREFQEEARRNEEEMKRRTEELKRLQRF